MRKPEKTKRTAFNETNRWWKKQLSIKDNEEALATMKHIGCPSRGVYLNMALKKMNQDFGPPKETV